MNEDGQSLLDLLVASGLALTLTGVLAFLLILVQAGFETATSETGTETHARDLLDEVGDAIRGARPIGWCPSAPAGEQYTTAIDHCGHVADYIGSPAGAPVPGGPLIFAARDQLWFWGYDAADSLALGVPDCVEVVAVPDRRVLVNRWRGAGTFTDATCPGVSLGNAAGPQTEGPPSSSEIVGTLDPLNGSGIFTTFGSDGQPTSYPPSIVLVSISATFTTRLGATVASNRPYPVEVDATVRGTAYADEQTWDAGS